MIVSKQLNLAVAKFEERSLLGFERLQDDPSPPALLLVLDFQPVGQIRLAGHSDRQFEDLKPSVLPTRQRARRKEVGIGDLSHTTQQLPQSEQYVKHRRFTRAVRPDEECQLLELELEVYEAPVVVYVQSLQHDRSPAAG